MKSDYVKVAQLEELAPGSTMTVAGIDKVDICLVNLDGEIFAFSDVCTHKGAPLHEGTIKGRFVFCPWHMARFRIDDGTGFWPAKKSIRSYEVTIEGNSIFVKKTPKAWDSTSDGASH
jgi:3-phenylpropionate/trans-cinnamate dioxygenase ferredoxin component